MPPMLPVESSWVHSIGYTPAFAMAADGSMEPKGRLYIRYKDKRGRITITARYRPDVPPQMWESLKAAPSKGVWVHQNVYHLPYDPV